MFTAASVFGGIAVPAAACAQTSATVRASAAGIASSARPMRSRRLAKNLTWIGIGWYLTLPIIAQLPKRRTGTEKLGARAWIKRFIGRFFYFTTPQAIRFIHARA